MGGGDTVVTVPGVHQSAAETWSQKNVRRGLRTHQTQPSETEQHEIMETSHLKHVPVNYTEGAYLARPGSRISQNCISLKFGCFQFTLVLLARKEVKIKYVKIC